MEQDRLSYNEMNGAEGTSEHVESMKEIANGKSENEIIKAVDCCITEVNQLKWQTKKNYNQIGEVDYEGEQ